MFRRASAVLVSVVLALGAQAAVARADDDPSGAQEWVVVSRSGQPTRVIAFGVVTSVGTVQDFLTLHLESGTFDNFAIQTFPEGTLLYHGQGPAILDLDPVTCIGRGQFIGPFAITGGTGAYEGATGSGTAIGDLTFVFDRTDTGCSATPIDSWGIAQASGELTVP